VEGGGRSEPSKGKSKLRRHIIPNWRGEKRGGKLGHKSPMGEQKGKFGRLNQRRALSQTVSRKIKPVTTAMERKIRQSPLPVQWKKRRGK